MNPPETDLLRYPLKKIVVSWSGGIDSTALIGCLLRAGWDVLAVSLTLYDKWTERYAMREALARAALRPVLYGIARENGGTLEHDECDASFIRNFALGRSMAIPQRNKRFLDLLMSRYVIPREMMNIGMGEYIGVDTWVVRDHVPPNDCDDRALSAYLFSEYGLGYRFVSLADFGESRYKSNRVLLGDASGVPMDATTNCMADQDRDCGECYKCVERAAAFDVAGLADRTSYVADPRKHRAYDTYVAQMKGFKVSMPYAAFPQHQ